jgi:hypothetical protein
MRDVTPFKKKKRKKERKKERKLPLIAIHEDYLVSLIGRKLTNKRIVYIA